MYFSLLMDNLCLNTIKKVEPISFIRVFGAGKN